MKKSFLLFSACLVAGFAQAQSRVSSKAQSLNTSTEAPLPVVINPVAPAPVTAPAVNNQPVVGPVAPHSGAKTTVALQRWYNFADDMLAPYQAYMSKGTYYYGYSMWNDTTGWIGYTGGTSPYSRSMNLSMAMGFDPTYSSTALPNYGWNTMGSGAVNDFSGLMAITYADAYTIDSVHVAGWYTRNYGTPAKTAVVDTLIISFVISPRTGSGIDMPNMSFTSPPAGYGVLSISYKDLYHDIANNRGAHAGGGVLASYVYKFPLTGADSTSNSNADVCWYPRRSTDPAISVPVPANNVMAMTATFKSGDNTFLPGGDTIRYSNGTAITGYKFNNYAMQVAFAATPTAPTALTDVTWPFVENTNQSCGYFMFASGGWGAPDPKYYPQWDIISGSSTVPGPAVAQYPRFGYHAVCNTCNVIGIGLDTKNVNTISNVVVAPNPANNVLNISFNSANTGATVTLTNSIGQQVASQVVANGNASFNTANLAEGVYIYGIDAKDGKSTGRVVIAH